MALISEGRYFWLMIFTVVKLTEQRRVHFAEREGFEPPEAFTSTVFETAAFDHSAISPKYKTVE